MRAIGVLALACGVVAVVADDCVFEFEGDGVKYDLNPIADSAPFTYTSGPTLYKYSLCKPVGETCNQVTNAMAVAVAANAPSTCFGSFGAPGSAGATLIGATDAGLQLAYSGGKCASDSSKQSTVTYEITCDVNGVASPHLVQLLGGSVSDCELQLKFASSAACPIRLSLAEVLSPAGLVVLIIVTIVLAYLVFGTLFNMGCRGASGMEALPNIAFWRRVGATLCSCCGCATPAAGSAGFYEEMEADLSPGHDADLASTRL